MRELTVPGTVLQNFLPIIFFSKISRLGTIACHGNQKPDLTIKKGLFCENLAVKGFMHSSNTNAYLSFFFLEYHAIFFLEDEEIRLRDVRT